MPYRLDIDFTAICFSFLFLLKQDKSDFFHHLFFKNLPHVCVVLSELALSGLNIYKKFIYIYIRLPLYEHIAIEFV